MRIGVVSGIALAGALSGMGALGCGTDSSADNGLPDASPDVVVDAGPDTAPPGAQCTEERLAGGCVEGHCRLTAPRGTLPLGTAVGLAEKPVPAEIVGDAVGAFLCEVALPQGGALKQELSLAIALDGAVDAASALFVYKPQGGSALVGTSSAQPSGVAGIVTDSGTFGVTKRSGGWTVDGYAGIDVNSTKDPASILRSIATNGVGAAYWDGTRLYVGNGARLLVYKGLPTSPGQAPDMILGQADLNTTSTTASSSVFRGGVGAVWSNGTKLVVGTGSRILVWSTLPTATFAPADLVLGQQDFSTDITNNGGVSASSLHNAAQVDSDGTRLAVADLLNHRVLLWDTFPVSLGQAATSVIGQPSFTSNGIDQGAAPIYQAWGVSLSAQGAFVSSQFGFTGVMHVPSAVAMNPTPDFATYSFSRVQPDTTYTPASLAQIGGGLAVRDNSSQRIGVFKAIPTAANPVYDFVLGQPDSTRTVTGFVNASSCSGVTKLSGAGNRLLVPDGNRLLVFDGPTYNYEPASFVFGQAGFSTNLPVDYRGIGATTLASPGAVAVSGGKVAVADRGNNRVTIYDQADLGAPPAAAKVVLGQTDARGYVANGDIVSATASRMSGPGGVALDATHLVVADSENHRVLIWSPVPTTSGAPANVVLGQADFAGRRPNHGRGDVAPADGFSDAAANGMFYPEGVATDGTHLVVADRLNHRVLVWNTIPTTNDAPADAVLGQASFTANQPNRGGGAYSASADGFDLPSAVSIRGTSLWVADTENNRAVRVVNAFTAPVADAWVGQPNATTISDLNYFPQSSVNVGVWVSPPTNAATVLRPLGVVATDSGIYVSERDSNRVHVFDPTTLAHVAVLGQTTVSGATANGPGLGAGSLSEPSGLATDGATLFVADAANHRVLGWNVATAPPTGAPATTFVGQPSPVSNGFNQASAASGGVSGRPHGLARFGTNLYVADTGHHRVVVLSTPPKAGDLPTRVIGQPDANLILPNSGGAPSARSLQLPRGVHVDAAHVVIADTGNHRVLVFDATSPSPDAVVVLGQTGFDKNAPNAGGAPALATLRAPEGVYSDGTRLFVADTGNSRVLVWNAFPTTSGQPADLVLGQAGGGDALPNHGAGVAGADTLANPTAVDVAGGALFIADAGNNRVLRFATIPTASGAAASSVLGQLDLTSRGAASSAADRGRLAGPVALAHDGANIYVVDRDQPRVAVFSLPADGTGVSAQSLLGASGGLTMAGPAGVAVEPTPLFTSRLYVADTNDDRLILVGSVSRLLGQ